MSEETVFWAVREPCGHINHTTICCEREDAIEEYMETEAAMWLLANSFRVSRGEFAHVTPTWNDLECEGFEVVQVKVVPLSPTEGQQGIKPEDIQ